MQNDKFKFEQVIRGDSKVVLLRGIIDEDTTFEQLGKLGSPIHFNFKGVTSINSCGVRSWVNFMKDISGLQVIYEECPPHIVRQLNMVPSFLGQAQVASVYIPYVCDDCDAETMVLAEASEFGKVAETIPCESCKKGEMEFDGHPQQYFAFRR